MAIYTVPAGKTAYMTKYYASIVGDPGPPARSPDYSIFRLYVADRANSYAPQLKHAVGGAMVGTSLVTAPAVLLAQMADWADLDGNLLIKNDPYKGVDIVKGKILIIILFLIFFKSNLFNVAVIKYKVSGSRSSN
mgnify:CR=1 FL=1